MLKRRCIFTLQQNHCAVHGTEKRVLPFTSCAAHGIKYAFSFINIALISDIIGCSPCEYWLGCLSQNNNQTITYRFNCVFIPLLKV